VIAGGERVEPQVDIKQLHAKIGQLALQNEFLAGALDRVPRLSHAAPISRWPAGSCTCVPSWTTSNWSNRCPWRWQLKHRRQGCVALYAARQRDASVGRPGIGQKAAMRRAAKRARNFTIQRCCLGSRVDERSMAVNRSKSRVRSKVEHAIAVIKCVFGFQKVRYRGLPKNPHRPQVTAGLANLFKSRRRLRHVV
jgi:hypothetical protein